MDLDRRYYALLIAAAAYDAGITLISMRITGRPEGNPFMRYAVDMFGAVPGLIGMKILGLCLFYLVISNSEVSDPKMEQVFKLCVILMSMTWILAGSTWLLYY